MLGIRLGRKCQRLLMVLIGMVLIYSGSTRILNGKKEPPSWTKEAVFNVRRRGESKTKFESILALASDLESRKSFPTNRPRLMVDQGWLDQRQRKDFLEQMVFVYFVKSPCDAECWHQVKSLVGGVHKLRVESGRVSKIWLIVDEVLTVSQLEEASIWSRVRVKRLVDFLGLPENSEVGLATGRLAAADLVAKTQGHLFLVHSGYVFDPASASYGEAERTQDPQKIRQALENSRKYLKSMYKNLETNGYVLVEDAKNKVRALEGYSHGHAGYKVLEGQLKGDPSWKATRKVFTPGDVGLVPYHPRSNLTCYLDINPAAIYNRALVPPIAQTKARMYLEGKKRTKRVAVGMPTTSKGLAPGDLPVFFNATVRTMLETLTPTELGKFHVDLYIGFDHGDKLFEDPKSMAMHIHRLEEMFAGKPISAKFYRLPITGRVGMLWSMLFHTAMTAGHADYFYQVNDDLRMVTPGWLTQFTQKLDSNGGYGVVGPFDNQVGLGCKLLSQAMVSRTHFEIFKGILYPLDLRDWKTDVWLSKVYGRENSFCWADVVATNGGSKTRYTHCPSPNWKLYLESGRKQIDQWKKSK